MNVNPINNSSLVADRPKDRITLIMERLELIERRLSRIEERLHKLENVGDYA